MATAKKNVRAARLKRADRKNISVGQAHIRSTFNNTIVSITDPQGNVISWKSAGQVGFKGSRKSTPFAAQMAAEAAAKQAMEHGMKKVSVFVKGPGQGREAAIRALQAVGLEVTDRINMAIDRTPVLKRCRQLGIDPAELGYSSKKESIRQPKRRRKESEYGMQLREKQKVKFIYGVLEKQFHGYFNKARKMNGVTGENLMIILESRLDNVVFRLGFARTRKEARQSVRHGHFTVNGKRVDIPSYRVKAGDVVAVGEKFRDLLPIKEALISSERFEVPGWLEVDIEKLSGNVLALPTREQISGDINEQLIVELYSK